MAIVRKSAIPGITGQTQELQSILGPMKESIETITGARSGVEPIKKLQVGAAAGSDPIVGSTDIINKINEIVVRLNVTGTAENDLTVVGDTVAAEIADSESAIGIAIDEAIEAEVGSDHAVMFRNRMHNSNFSINQRGAGTLALNTSGGYPCDRWIAVNNSDCTATAAIMTTGTPPTTSATYLRINITAADASVGASQYLYLSHAIEGINVADFLMGTANAVQFTISFKVRSTITGTLGAACINSGQNRAYPFTVTINAANTWEYKTVTIQGDTSGTWLGYSTGIGMRIWFAIGGGSTFVAAAGAWAAGNYIGATGQTNFISSICSVDFAEMKCEKGSVATPYYHEPWGFSYPTCQRYYEQNTRCIVGPGLVTNGYPTYATYEYKQTKRVTPTLVLTYIGNSGYPLVAPTIGINDVQSFEINATANATTTGYMVFSYTSSADI